MVRSRLGKGRLLRIILHEERAVDVLPGGRWRPWIAVIPTASKRLSATDPAIAQIALLAKITGWLDVAGGFNMFQYVLTFQRFVGIPGTGT